MKRAVWTLGIAGAVCILAAAPALAANCGRNLQKTGGGDLDFVCDVKSDFDTEFVDCFTFSRIDDDVLNFKSLALGAPHTKATCNADGTYLHPGFGDSTIFSGTFFSPFAITFTGDTRRGTKPHIFDGWAHNQFGDRFVLKCERDNIGFCPLVVAPAVHPGVNPWRRPPAIDESE